MERQFGKFTVLVLIICLTTGIANAADLTSGMVGCWPLDGDAKDSVGGNDGKLVGNPKWVKGHIGQSIELDGSSQRVDIPDFSLTTETITFVAWINGWKAVDWAGIVSSRFPSACEMIFGDNDTLHYVWNDNSDQTWSWSDGPVIPQNEWAMTAMAIEPDKATAYVYSDADGLKQGVNAIPHIEQTVGELHFGWVDCCGGTRYYRGIIDEVMIYDYALTENDVLQLAVSGLAVYPAGKLTTTWGMIKQ